MSDYKDLVDNLLNKAKDLAASESVTGVVGKVKEAASGTGITDILEKGTQRAKNFGNATKITLDLNRDCKELERVFSEIGKLYYEHNVSSPEGFFAPLFEQAGMLRESIAAKQAEIEAYKASFESSNASPSQAEANQELDGRIDDFESIVNQTETDGRSL